MRAAGATAATQTDQLRQTRREPALPRGGQRRGQSPWRVLALTRGPIPQDTNGKISPLPHLQLREQTPDYKGVLRRLL